MLVITAVQIPPPLIRRYAPPSPKVREKAYIATANISYSDLAAANSFEIYFSYQFSTDKKITTFRNIERSFKSAFSRTLGEGGAPWGDG